MAFKWLTDAQPYLSAADAALSDYTGVEDEAPPPTEVELSPEVTTALWVGGGLITALIVMAIVNK